MGIPRNTIEFSRLVDVIVEAGYSDEMIEEVREDLFKVFPKLQKIALDQAMSTVQRELDVPMAWAQTVLDGLRIDYDLREEDPGWEEDTEDEA